jgi:hypothetical protein
MKDESLFDAVAVELEKRYGPVDAVSSWFPFDFTGYYEKEMGAPLKRRLISFQNHLPAETLPDAKLAAIEIEAQFSKNGRRRVNIDPGFLTLERFVLATGKNYTHRIYLRSGIYADLTLLFTGGQFVTLDWTYPDYATDSIRAFLADARQRYRLALRSRPGEGEKGAAKPPAPGDTREESETP